MELESTQEKLNFILITSMCLVFYSLEMLRILVQTKLYYIFCYFVWRKMSHKHVQVAATKRYFQSAYVIDSFGLINFFISCENWKISFFIHIYRYPEVWWNRHVVVFFKNKCSDRSPHFISIISKIRLQCCQCQRSTIKFLILQIITDSVLLLFQFVNVPHFLYKWNF